MVRIKLVVEWRDFHIAFRPIKLLRLDEGLLGLQPHLPVASRPCACFQLVQQPATKAEPAEVVQAEIEPESSSRGASAYRAQTDSDVLMRRPRKADRDQVGGG